MTADDELRRALARQAPPAGFEERLAAKLRMPRPDRRQGPHVRYWRWLTAAALVVAVFGGVVGYRDYRVRNAEAIQATEDTRTALRIASDTLVLVRQRVRASTERSQ